LFSTFSKQVKTHIENNSVCLLGELCLEQHYLRAFYTWVCCNQNWIY